MKQTMILTGDVNLLGATDPTAPFSRVADTLNQADVVFGNLECCVCAPPEDQDPYEGFYVGSALGSALKLAGYKVVGCANNVTFGSQAIRASLARLDELRILHTGAGINQKAARTPAILEIKGVRYGFIQRTSIFWPIGHEASENSTGIAALKAYTAYQLPVNPAGKDWNRPGVPPTIITWTDPGYLAACKEDIASLKQHVDVVVSSYHWGYRDNMLQYMTEVGHASIDAGADIVLGTGPHMPLAVEVYKGKAIFYSVGAFSFLRRHPTSDSPLGLMATDWIGLMVRVTLEDREIVKVTCLPVHASDPGGTVIRSVSEERATMEQVASLSAKFNTTVDISGDEAVVWQKGD